MSIFVKSFSQIVIFYNFCPNTYMNSLKPIGLKLPTKMHQTMYLLNAYMKSSAGCLNFKPYFLQVKIFLYNGIGQNSAHILVKFLWQLMTSAKGTSINGVGNWEDGKGLKIGQNCQRIVLKNYWHGGGGVKNPKKLPTLFMDGL